MTEITNFLIGTLIALVAYIAKTFHAKVEQILEYVKQISIHSQKHDSEISELKETVKDHEIRLREQEHNH